MLKLVVGDEPGAIWILSIHTSSNFSSCPITLISRLTDALMTKTKLYTKVDNLHSDDQKICKNTGKRLLDTNLVMATSIRAIIRINQMKDVIARTGCRSYSVISLVVYIPREGSSSVNTAT